MKAAVVILSMFAVAMCAPVGEIADVLDVDSEEMRVKRAKEFMMFGNQQNDQQRAKAKRADPSESADQNGYINAKEPIDLETEDAKEPTEVEETLGDTTGEESDGADTVIEEQENQETEATPVDDVESTETEESEETTAVEPIDNEADQMSVEDYLKEIEMLGDSDNISPYFNNVLKGRDPYWNQYRYYNPYNNYQRYRRSQGRALKNFEFPRARVLKRAHRTKRQAYYVPDMQGYLPYDDGLIDTLYNKYPVTEDDLTDMLDVLDESRVYDDDVYVNPYEEYAPYEDLGDIEFESPIYVPKRQAGLTFVPGIKRNRDFFPYFSEPEAHYAAFVPEKRSMRDYADAYERVMELAAALRQQNNYPEDYLEGYRRRK